MRAILVALALALVSCHAQAGGTTYRCPDGVVSAGSSNIADLIKRCGQPSRTVPLENVYGARVGERWEYYIGEKVVMFTIRAGKVERVDEA